MPSSPASGDSLAARLARGVRAWHLRVHLRRLLVIGALVTFVGGITSIYYSVVGTKSCQEDASGREVCKTTEWYPLTLQRRSERVTVDGTPHGPRTEWYASGRLWLSGDYADGKRHGTWSEWYADGTPRFSGTYDADRLHGVESWWYPSGHLEWQVSRQHGERQGQEFWWHSNGQRRRAGTYDKGERHGRFTLYGVDGDEAFQVEYHRGIRVGGAPAHVDG